MTTNSGTGPHPLPSGRADGAANSPDACAPGAFYNEIDPKAAAWLRALIEAGEIAPGHVEGRSIADVGADDLAGVRRAHFFAGIGGWDLALRLAGWPDDWPVWTGSCPCQPFSVAGKGKGEADERHLWPEFRRLIAECRPPIVLGEQVASAAGRSWLAAVSADLEALGYAVASADLCAAGVGAPHIRQRLYFGAVRLADAAGVGAGQRAATEPRRNGSDDRVSWAHSAAGRLADADSGGRGEGVGAATAARHGHPAFADGGGDAARPHHLGWAAADWLLCRDGKWRPVIPSYVTLADGISPAMVYAGSGNYQSEKEDINAETSQSGPREVLSSLRGSDGAQEDQRQARRHGGVPASSVLQQDVHGAWHGEGCVPQPEPQPLEGGGDSKDDVRGVRRERAAARSPQGRGPYEQHAIELADIVPVLPSEIALAEFHGRRRDAEALQALQSAICEAGPVRHSPDQVAAAWASLGKEDKARIAVGFGGSFRRVMFSPLSEGEPARVGRLRGYGNAIVPEVAAQFIRAFRETLTC